MCQVSTITPPCLYSHGPDSISFSSLWLTLSAKPRRLRASYPSFLVATVSFWPFPILPRYLWLCTATLDCGCSALPTPFWMWQFSGSHCLPWDILRGDYDIPGDVQISMTVTTIENRVHIMAKDLHTAQVKQWLHETKLSMNPCSVLWYFLFHSLSSLLMPVLTRSINQFYDTRS